MPSVLDNSSTQNVILPGHYDLYYDGEWKEPINKGTKATYNPGNGQEIAKAGMATSQDVDSAVQAAHKAFQTWRSTPPAERAAYLLKAAEVCRQHADEFALLDAVDTGNPVNAMVEDAYIGATGLQYFAGLIPMLQGETIPFGDQTFHYTVREPLGVVARIVAYNHPLLFAASRIAAPLAAGNTVIVKPPDQSPLSCLRLAELIGPIFPPGVVNFLPGGVECGKALTTHPLVQKVTLIGSVPTGKAIQQALAPSLKPTTMELGGKNALLAFPDADPDIVAQGIAAGMNFTWAGQSCGSTSRVFLHESHYEDILEKAVAIIKRDFIPGNPTDPTTTMGPLISKVAQDRVLDYISKGKQEGARLVLGGKIPDERPDIKGGFFVEPTIFADVQQHMTIAREEIFGPVVSIFKWSDLDKTIADINSTPFGLTGAIYTKSIGTAHTIARRIDSAFIWINHVAKHYQGVPFGGMKESGIGREECVSELLDFTEVKSVSIRLDVF